MKMKSIKIGVMILVLFVGFLTFDVSADTPKLWDRVIGETYEDYAMGVAVDSNNNIIVAGYLGSGNGDFLVVKYDSSGNQLWNKTAGTSATDIYDDVAVDSSDNIIAAGYTGSFGGGGMNFWTIKYDRDGNQLWNRTANGGGHDYAYDVAVDSGDNIIVVGERNFTDTAGYDCWIIKYDSNGNHLWNKTVGGDNSENCYGVAVDSNNSIIVAGDTSTFGAGLSDGWVLKYNSAGTQLWNITRGGTSYDYANDVAVDSNNNIIVTGYYGLRRLTIKYNSSGSICGIERM